MCVCGSDNRQDGEWKEKRNDAQCRVCSLPAAPRLRRRVCNCSVPGHYSMPTIRPSWSVPSAQACHLSDSTQFNTCCLEHELANHKARLISF